MLRKFLAWCVHGYTALGLVCAAGVAVLIVEGSPESFRRAFVLMLVATLIDATDGTLARRARVKEVLPGFDGRRLDDLIDFLTYPFLPLLLLWRAEVLAPGLEAVLLAPLLASAYGFCQTEVKTEDGYFLGFPSHWNMVAFYLYVMRWPQPVTLALVLGLSLLTFVPTRYLYPSNGRSVLNVLTNALGAVWVAMMVGVLWRLPADEATGGPGGTAARRLGYVSLFYPVFYMGASWAVSLRLWLRRRVGTE